ncbi:hypothetical protein AYO44_06785 [Planctomycetaceae bacterium SCGC AG-212-F19]|nr:hypothetical protein AYO44_06785 [Planctomycetaceae bacterium SCGC AG-212-F19]
MFWATGWVRDLIGESTAQRKPARPPKAQPALEELETRVVPTLLGQQVFPLDNAWNQNIANAPVASNSSNVINHISAATNNARLFNDFYHDSQNTSQVLYGIPITIVHGNTTAKVNVVIDNYPSESDLDPTKPASQHLGWAAPVPTNAVIEGDFQGGVHRTAAQGNTGDRHMIIWDRDNNIAYEFYGTTPPSENGDGKWHAAEETVWDLKNNTFANPSRQVGWTSVDAAGLSVLAGLARPDEMAQGIITHALRFTLQNSLVLNQYVYPASHHANPGSANDPLNLPPMGARFRLKASVDISTLDPQAKIVAQALKDYGLILADNGSSMFVSGASSVFDADTNTFWTWNDALLWTGAHGLRTLHVSDFELVDLTPRVTGLSTTTGAAGTSLTVIGQNFSGAGGFLTVFFGNTAGTNVTLVDDAHISVTVPTGSGTVDVTVRSGRTNMPGDSSTYNSKYPVFGYGTSATSAADKFTYGSGTNQPPTVATAASATPGLVTGLTTILSVLGADDGGEAALTYTWAATAKPTGAANPSFSANGTNAAKNNTATFSQAGAYTFQVTIRDAGGLTVTSSVNVTVNQTLKSIAVTPASVNLALNGTQQYTASAKDQFGIALTTQPSFTWSLVSGPGSVSAAGLFTATSTAGTATIRATSGTVNGNATAIVGNTAPTVQTPPAAAPNPVTGTTANLSVLGKDDGGEAALTYTWSVVAKPTGATNPSFSVNGTNAAKNSTATFSLAGAYTLRVTISDGSLSTTSDLAVTVAQTLTTIVVSPNPATVSTNATQQFAASGQDQFGVSLTTQPAFTWSLASGSVGSISTAGLYTAGAAAGSATVRATSGAITGTAAITVTASNTAPTVATAASASPSPVTAKTTNLSVLGADNGGEAALTYTWATTGTPPAAVTFSANGTNAAKNTTATFTKAGAYSFQVTIRDAGGLTATSSVNVTVTQTLASITVAPASVSLANSATQQFTATALDQFGNSMSPTIVWSLGTGGVGAISSSGLYTAPASGTGSATVQATSGSVTGTGSVTVTSSATRREAESLTLAGGYVVEANSAASAGNLIRISSAGVTATATGTFTGAAGTYKVTVAYYDESDGASTFTFKLNGTQIDTWVANQNITGSSLPDSTDRFTRTVGTLSLKPGDTFSITGLSNQSEFARVDYIDFAPQAAAIRMEAESLTLAGSYIVEANSSASGGNLIRMNGSGASGTATGTFNGPAGNYQVVIGYYDESDGASTFGFKLNGTQIDSWVANQNTTGSSSPDATNRFTRTVGTLSLKPGDVFTLTGLSNSGEYARFDYIDFIPM